MWGGGGDREGGGMTKVTLQLPKGYLLSKVYWRPNSEHQFSNMSVFTFYSDTRGVPLSKETIPPSGWPRGY